MNTVKPRFTKAVGTTRLFFLGLFLIGLLSHPTGTFAGREICSFDFPLQLSDGTNLPEPFATDVQLEERMKQLQQHYAPFTRNLTPKVAYTRPETVLSSEAVWLFREDTEARGEMDRWFAMEVPQEGWVEQQLPDYREFVLGWYRTVFDATAWSSDRTILHFDAVDYAARVYLNERYIGEHTGYFAPFEFDVTDLLKPTGNVLAVRVDNPVCFQGYRKDSLHGDGFGTVAFNNDRGVVQLSNAAGIYQPVKLIGRSNTHISGLKITPVWPATAKVEARIVNLTESPSDLDVTVSVIPRNFEGQETTIHKSLPVSKENVQVSLCKLNDPKYWTPDETYLYTARVVIRDSKGKVLDCVDESFGMRWMSEMEDGTILLNKQPRFLRGSSAQGNFWLSSVQQDDNSTIRDILFHKAAHVDALRVISHVLPEWFYQYADMYGLMIYQDMPLNGIEGFNAASTDITPIHAEEIKRQFRDAVDLLYNHPSIAIWEFINESHVLKPEPQIPPAVKEFVRLSRQIDPTRLVSGASGFTSTSFPTNPNREWWGIGDFHLYAGLILKTWAWVDYQDDISKISWFTPEYKKLMTEYGSAFAYPGWQTWIDSFVPWEPPNGPEELYDVRRIPTEEPVFNAGSYLSDVMALNLTTKIFGTNARPLDWIRRTQDHQAYLQRVSNDVWRRRPDCGGYNQYHMIDPGPMTWACSLVDCNRRPKKAYYSFAQANVPQRANIQYEGRRFHSGTNLRGMRLWVYNDYNKPLKARLRAVLADKDGKILAQQQWDQVIGGATRAVIDKFECKLPQIDSGREKLYVYAIVSEENSIIDYDCLPIEVFALDPPPQAPSIAIYELVGKTAGVLANVGLEFEFWKPGQSLENTALLIIGAYSSDSTLTQAKEEIEAFINQGGAVLVLNQTNPDDPAFPEAFKPEEVYAETLRYGVTARMPLERDVTGVTCDLSWMPFDISLVPPSWLLQTSYAQNLGRNSLTAGLNRNDLFEWHGGFGYVVASPINYRDNEDENLITCGPWQSQSAVVLKKHGSGKLLFSQLLLVDRYGVDPIATHILNRMFNPDNWKKTPVLVNKSATLGANGTELNVEVTIENTTIETVTGDIVDPVLQDLKTENEIAQFVQSIRLEPGEAKTVQFTRTLDKVYAGDLPAAVFVFDDGLWSCSDMVAVGWQWDKLEKVRTYDFGTANSPVADGATKVIPGNVFSSGQEFGWNEHAFSADCTPSEDPLMRDYHYYQLRSPNLHAIQESPRVFSVRLPAGQYIFRLMAGDTVTGAVAHVASDTIPPVTIQCSGEQAGRLVRQVAHGTATVTFEHILEQDGVVEISLAPFFKGQAVMVSALEVYKAAKN